MSNQKQTLAARLRDGLPHGSIAKLAETCGVSRQTVYAQLTDADKTPDAPVVQAAMSILRENAARVAGLREELDTILPA